MTKMTMLHFASPFAFSMPVPPAVVTESGGTAEDPSGQAPGMPVADDIASLKAATETDGASDQGSAGGFDGGGFEASLMETVLKRYRDQQGPGGSAAEESGPDQPT